MGPVAGRPLLRLSSVGAATLAVVLLAATGASARAARPAFATGPAGAELIPAFSWSDRDYVVRCDSQPSLAIDVAGAPHWRTRVSRTESQPGSFSVERRLSPGDAFTVTFRRSGSSRGTHFHVRCLPADYPNYDFERIRPGGVRFFGTQIGPYATIFDSDGAPIWWADSAASPNNVEVLPDGTVAWDPVDPVADVAGIYEIRSLSGRVLRTVSTPGATTDLHELLLLPNGNYLLGGRVTEHHIDTSPYGGPADTDVRGIEVQEVTPKGKVVWKWDSSDHIAVSETPQRWWDSFILKGNPPYDIVHWNAAEPDGKYVLLSFRHLDAVYAINRNTGNVVWKLGGTHTSKSLKVVGDPQGSYPLGGQHDVRALPDGTISIHDNNTGLPDPPRAVRYRIDLKHRTAHFVSALTDPSIPNSVCCGSARMSPSGSWLVGWGGNPVTTAYDALGRPLYRLTLTGGFGYRAQPVPPGAATAHDFRHGMNRMQP